MEIRKDLSKKEIEKKARDFVFGVEKGKWYTRHYIVLMDWLERDDAESERRYSGQELKVVPYDYSGGDYKFIAEVETFGGGVNRYSDGEGNYYDKKDVPEMIVKAIEEYM